MRLVLLLALLACLAASAANVEDRSPFRQGHWWDSGRSGHGFEILNAGENVFVVWYTYDAASRPTWYTAQGTVATMGSSWPLQKHRWAGERIAESTTVGSINLTLNHFESMTATWVLDGAQASWKIEPFVQSGTINEVDLSGHWHDPANSGWGMTLVDQGDVFGAVIYAYDPSGQPTWVAGFDRGKGTRIDLHSTRGPCPSCAQRPVTTTPAGSIDIGYRGDTEIIVRGAPSIGLAAGLRINGANGRQIGRPASARNADYQLVPFRSDRLLKNLLVAGMEHRIFGSAGSDFSASPPSPTVNFSTTNLQVDGVDEADVLKSDGRYVYAVTPITYTPTPPYWTTRKVRIARVGDAGSNVTPVGEMPLAVPANSTSYTWDAGLYLHSGNLVAIATSQYYWGWYYSPAPTVETTIEIFGLANPAAPASRYRATLPGTMVSSRRIGDRLYVVTRFTPSIPGYVSYAYTDAQRSANRELAAATPIVQMLPWISENGGAKVVTTPLSSIYAPQFGGNVAVADMVVVSAFDLKEARLAQSLVVIGRTETMFVSDSAIYLASSRYDTRPVSLSLLPAQRSLLNTDVHKIAIDGDMRVVGSGSVEGWINGSWNPDKAAFRFGEVGGRLGVVTSTTLGWWGANSNRVTLLEPSNTTPGLLKTVSWLPNATRPQTLGKPGEALYGTRFVGDKLYAVTFRQVDPLYIVDLANASDPRITGELEIPGFSDYLHPLGNGLLLGFGREATPDGWMQGLHLTLFDVSGSAPREMQRWTIGKRGSDSALFRSHHAFSTLRRPDGSTAVAFPVTVADGVPTGSGPTAWYPWAYSGLMRFDIVGSSPANARIVLDRTLVVARPGVNAPSTNDEASYGQARSVLFPDASLYVSGGRFYQQDASSAVNGPY